MRARGPAVEAAGLGQGLAWQRSSELARGAGAGGTRTVVWQGSIGDGGSRGTPPQCLSLIITLFLAGGGSSSRLQSEHEQRVPARIRAEQYSPAVQLQHSQH